MRQYSSSTHTGSVPHAIFKQGLLRVRGPGSSKPLLSATLGIDGKMCRAKRPSSPTRHSVKYRHKTEKTFKKTDCGCGCKGE